MVAFILDAEYKGLFVYFPLALFFCIGIGWIYVAYRAGDWRNWRKYYPTILFFWCGDLIYNIVFYKKPLWVFENPAFSHQFTDLLSLFIVFTCTVLIFIPRYPKPFGKQLVYLGYWILLYSGIEWIFYVLGGITYENGWNIWWSVLHNVYQFILLIIHQSKPILAWVLSIIILFIIASVFHVSLMF